MPVFNFASTFGKKAASQNYGFLVDQVDIKLNELSADGRLGPGDYEEGIAMLQKLYTHPGLTIAQRSNIAVKISNLQSQKKVKGLQEYGDIERMNREYDDDVRANNMFYSSILLFY